MRRPPPVILPTTPEQMTGGFSCKAALATRSFAVPRGKSVHKSLISARGEIPRVFSYFFVKPLFEKSSFSPSRYVHNLAGKGRKSHF